MSNKDHDKTNSPLDGVDVLSVGEEAPAAAFAFVKQTEAVPVVGKRPTTTLKEVYSYYLYYAGANGLPFLNYGSSQLTNLVYLAGWDPTVSPPTPGNCGDNCVLPWRGGTAQVSSILLDVSGIAFALQAMIMLVAGSFSDYGSNGRHVNTVATIICFIVGFGWLGVASPDKWRYSSTSSGHSSLLPMFTADHEELDSRNRNRIVNISVTWCVIGGSLTLLPAIGYLKALHVDDSTANNTWGYSVTCGYTTGMWLLLSIPWLLYEQPRIRQALPPGRNYFSVGFVNLWQALKEVRKLKQTMLFLLGYFLFGDCVNTCYTLEQILQAQVISFSTTTYNYIEIGNQLCQAVGYMACWYAMKYFRWKTKTITLIICAGGVLCQLWGMVGLWTDKLGFHNTWEVYAFMAVSGAWMNPWYQMSFIMIPEVVPKTKVFLFYGLFGILGKSASFAGPFITSAIISKAGGNTNAGFTFLFATSLVAFAIIYFVDVEKSHIECKAYMDAEGKALYSKPSETKEENGVTASALKGDKNVEKGTLGRDELHMPDELAMPASLANLSAEELAAVAKSSGRKIDIAVILYGGSIVILSWITGSMTQPAVKRAVAIGVINAACNTPNVWTPYLYSGAPRYTLAFIVNSVAAFGAVGFAVATRIYLKRKNAELERGDLSARGAPTQQQVDGGFRYVL
ncbi:Autophagy-related protein [Pseudohyphozyma bogoriensis]|nr:Autophagy-related protein [Pseudohyphozyma bogoriensis]